VSVVEVLEIIQYSALVVRSGYTGNDKKCMEYEVEGTRPRGRPKKTWRQIVEKDCRARGLNREDAMDRLMTTMRVVGECFFWYRLTRVFPDKFHRAVKRLCVVCVKVEGKVKVEHLL